MKKNIVIIGAGYAGILTAKKLTRKLIKSNDVYITIIDKNSFHTMITELHEVAAGRVDEDSIKLNLKRVFAGRNVDVKLDMVESIDFIQKHVIGKREKYTYDILVIAAGSRPTFFGVEGADEFALKLWSYEDAVLLRNHICDCFRKASNEPDISKKLKLLSFYIVGAGFTGTEITGELAEYIPVLCQKYDIEQSLVKVHCVDVLSRPVPALTEKLSAKIEKRLEKMGVTVLLNTGVVKIGEDFIELKKDNAIKRHEAGTVIWAAGIESSEITCKASQVLPSAERNRLATDKHLRSAGDSNVFVVGDNVGYIPEGEKYPVPQLVENCEQSADVAAHNIICTINGDIEGMKAYRPSFHGVMVSVGGRYGVAYVGTHKKDKPTFVFGNVCETLY